MKHDAETTPEPPTAAPADSAAPATPAGNNGTLPAEFDHDDALREMMARNFIEYASYVIKERAIPALDDGLKPVQRRILHTLWEHEDGRFHKVANIVGATMRYHPHGDASIYEALVVLANTGYFIDRQGNFGNLFTGDPASAARYIECRLSALAKEVLFNPEITEFTDSYDGRNREPVVLPAKIPVLLLLGVKGIAVGMSTTIFPHNFTDLLRAQIAILKEEPFAAYPDFPTGGAMDVGEYADGAGRIRLRALIEAANDKTLVIRQIPAETTTESLIASIERAVRAGKLKIASINDYTAENVEVEITLPRGVHAEETIKLLYAHTDCEVSLSSNLLVIKGNRPAVMTVSEILRHNTAKLQEDLRRELELELERLNGRFHEKTLAQLFIEHRIYKRIEECETLEAVQREVRTGMEQLLARHFRDNRERFAILAYAGATLTIPPPQARGIRDDDLERLLAIPIRRISLFDIQKNQREIEEILRLIAETQDHLRHLKRFTIRFLEGLLRKYGHLFPRRTQIADLAEVNVREVALRNLKVGHDRTGQFVGHAVKNSNKEQEPLPCSEYDRLVLLRNDGGYKVVPVPEKMYVGPVKFVLLADREQVYSLVYRDKKSGAYYAKRFRIDKYILEKEYSCLPPGCVIEALYTNYGVQLRCELVPQKRLRTEAVELDFDLVELRAAAARGFKLSDHEIARILQIKRGTAEAPAAAGPDADAEAEPQPPPPAESAPAAPAPLEPAAPTAEVEPPEADGLSPAEHFDRRRALVEKRKAARRDGAPTPESEDAAAAPTPPPAAAAKGRLKKRVAEDEPFFLE
ncbi:MAG: DNA gyrase subunit A [Lentisphaeria bacterium]|jgi:topoisomerase-4 subunit A